MIYVWAAIAIAILFLIWQIIRWWNLPATIEARQKSAEARAKRWQDWRDNRPRLIPRRSTPIPQPPTADTAEAIKRATKPPLLDGPVARRIRARRNKDK